MSSLKGLETLNAKDANTFRSLAKFYQAKNYKKGLKTAQKLLESNPNHPQTLAMKALFMFNNGQQEKALVEAKAAIFKSKLKSQMCWHTYGIMLRQKRDYVEAVKSYQNALKIEPDNIQILRDTALMQIHIRDHVGHCITRFQILKQKPDLIQSWLGFTLAKHLKGEFDDVIKALGSINNLMISIKLKPQQKSSYLIYKCIAYEQGQKYTEFYNELKRNQKQILDKVVYKQLLTKACIKLGKLEEAQQNIQNLLKQFPQNSDYFKLYQNFKNIGQKETDKLIEFYENIATKFSSKISQLYKLNVIQDKQIFQREFLKFVIPYFQRNIISLFSEIKILYQSSQRAEWIGEVFDRLQQSLRDNKYPSGQEMESPSEYLWALYLKSQYLSTIFQRLPEALIFIQKALAHTPTIQQLYITKAQILYGMHNKREALLAINEARKMDLADRYMNNICVKYLLRCFKQEIAEDIIKLFMKEESNAYDLQNMWYEIELGKSFLNVRQFGPGFRHLNFIQKQFGDMYEDQFDFHSYALRKWNLKEYLELIRYSDDIYNDKKYIEAAGLMIKYLIEYDQSQKESKQQPVKEQEKQTVNKKQNKKKKKKKEVEEQDPREVYRKKIDYYGKQYLENLKDPYIEALSYAKNVMSVNYVNKNNRNLNKLYFRAFAQCINLFIHLNKPLLCLKALKQLAKTKFDQQEQHSYRVKSLIYFEKVLLDEKLHALTRQVITEQLKKLLQEVKNASEFNQKVISSWTNNYENELRKSQLTLIFKNANRNQYIQLYTNELNKELNLKNTFLIVHKLEFYGRFTETQRNSLSEKFKGQTTYFNNLSQAIDNFHNTQWTNWWLSDYDKEREQQRKSELQKAPKQQTKQQIKKQ